MSDEHAQTPVDLSIIIVSWNVWDLLRACLTSIDRGCIDRACIDRTSIDNSSPNQNDPSSIRLFGSLEQPYMLEVIVVDNASTDATPDFVPTCFPWVQFIPSDVNLGFTGGNNRGYQSCRGEYVYFLNPDTELVGDSLLQLFRLIRQEPTVGMVGPRLQYADGMAQNNRRRFPTRLTGFFESTWLAQRWSANPWAVKMHMLDWPDNIQHDVDWLVGAAMLARREALEQAVTTAENFNHHGPFDEGFFMYSEELDLCKRIKSAGWRIVFTPKPLVTHYEGRSSEQAIASRYIYFNQSKVRYYHKYFGRFWSELLRCYLLIEFRWQLLTEWIKFMLYHKRDLRLNRIDVYQAVLDSRLHSCTYPTEDFPSVP